MNFVKEFIEKNSKNSGITIGYRRVSGKIGLTQNEKGKRGSWVEKRVALLRNLLNLNYKIKLLSKTSDETNLPINNNDFKFLILEFGGTNYNFYKKDWDNTVEIIKKFDGNILFINDDPDLPFLWNLLDNENWERWTVGVNAVNTLQAKNILKCPIKTKVVDIPMFKGMVFKEFNNINNPEMIYIGRPNGRNKYFNEFLKCKQLSIAGKEKEWIGFEANIVDMPDQKDRSEFYRKFNSSLTIYDTKHKLASWRTGRAFHAIYAGIPVCSPKGNYGLNWCYPVETYTDIIDFINSDKEFRETIWNKQKNYLENIKFDYDSIIRH